MDIKNCLHCGGTANIWQNSSRRGWFTFVKCDLCGAQTRIFGSEEEPEAAE